jgi:hypothetical protein
VLPRSSEKGTSCVEGCVETRAAVSGEASSGSEKRRAEARRDETRRNETRVGRADGKREAKVEVSHSQSRPGSYFSHSTFAVGRRASLVGGESISRPTGPRSSVTASGGVPVAGVESRPGGESARFGAMGVPGGSVQQARRKGRRGAVEPSCDGTRSGSSRSSSRGDGSSWQSSSRTPAPSRMSVWTDGWANVRRSDAMQRIEEEGGRENERVLLRLCPGRTPRQTVALPCRAGSWGAGPGTRHPQPAEAPRRSHYRRLRQNEASLGPGAGVRRRLVGCCGCRRGREGEGDLVWVEAFARARVRRKRGLPSP